MGYRQGTRRSGGRVGGKTVAPQLPRYLPRSKRRKKTLQYAGLFLKPMSGLEPLTPSLRATPSESTAVYAGLPAGAFDLQIAEMLLGRDGQP